MLPNFHSPSSRDSENNILGIYVSISGIFPKMLTVQPERHTHNTNTKMAFILAIHFKLNRKTKFS